MSTVHYFGATGAGRSTYMAIQHWLGKLSQRWAGLMLVILLILVLIGRV